jgi:hypothetical protein
MPENRIFIFRFMHDLLGSFVKHTTNIENKNTLPGEILQCCRGASYILLATWKNTLGYQKPPGYDSKLNVLNMFSFAMSSVYCTANLAAEFRNFIINLWFTKC